MTLENDYIKLLLNLASMYYEENATQQEIAKKYNMSRSLVSKYLKNARDLGLVQINIRNDYLNPYYNFEQDFIKKFQIKNIICVESHEIAEIQKSRVVSAANNFLLNQLTDGDSVTIAGGTTINDMSTTISTTKKFPNTTFISMSGGLGDENLNIQTNKICENFANRLHSKVKLLFAPVLVDSIEARNIFLQQSFIKSILNAANNATIALVGIGGKPNNSTLANAYINQYNSKSSILNQVVGDICYNFLDKFGNLIDCEWNQRVITLGINQLKNIPHVIAVAEGKHKYQSIYAALKQNLIDSLIIDYKTALMVYKIE
ncbi:sugar-binding transcriptional regulator [Helcococcus kunzii]